MGSAICARRPSRREINDAERGGEAGLVNKTLPRILVALPPPHQDPLRFQEIFIAPREPRTKYFNREPEKLAPREQHGHKWPRHFIEVSYSFFTQ